MNDWPICPECGKEQAWHNVQVNPISGTEVDLYHCTDPDCDLYLHTVGYNPRPIEPARLKKMRDALRAIVAHPEMIPD